MLLNGHPGAFSFFGDGLPEKGTQFFLGGGCVFYGNYDMVVVLVLFLCNYDNLALILHQGKRCYPDKGWIFIGRFKVGSVPGISVAIEVSKKASKSIMSIMQGHQ